MSAPNRANNPGRKATLSDIHIAVQGGNITREEGRALNPKYNRGNSKSINMQASKSRKKAGNTLTEEERQARLKNPPHVKESDWGEVWT